MAKYGYWRVGGPADLLVDVHDEAQLAAVMDTDLPVTVLGNGSNLLVSDAGIRGIVVRLRGTFRELSYRDPSNSSGLSSHLSSEAGLALVGAGMMNSVLLARLDKAGLGGAGSLAGVPGTIGGAVKMNAGTRVGEFGDAVAFVRAMLPNGSVTNLTADQLAFRYRHSTLPDGAIVTRVAIWVSQLSYAEERSAVEEHVAYRKSTQPLDQPSCGSTFKNPPGDSAGRLIEAAGLKGAREGGAMISEKHANFFVNTGSATANDIYTLIKRARDTVYEQFEVLLEPEVRAAGEWPDGCWPL